MSMNIKEKVKSAVNSVSNSIKYVPATLAAVAAFGLGMPKYASAQNSKPKYATVQEAMKVLGVSNPSDIKRLPNGYMTLRGIPSSNITLSAGLYDGSIHVEKKISNGKSIELASGSYSYLLDPAALKFAVKEADTNGDHIITYQESAKGLENAEGFSLWKMRQSKNKNLEGKALSSDKN